MKDVNVYEAPQVEIIEVEVEKGFATSGGATSEGLKSGSGDENVW